MNCFKIIQGSLIVRELQKVNIGVKEDKGSLVELE
jgi:hypothetical protein